MSVHGIFAANWSALEDASSRSLEVELCPCNNRTYAREYGSSIDKNLQGHEVMMSEPQKDLSILS